jgi:hypothetical protein
MAGRHVADSYDGTIRVDNLANFAIISLRFPSAYGRRTYIQLSRPRL